MIDDDDHLPESLDLPELVLGPIRYPIGYAMQLLQSPRTVGVTSVKKIQISPRIVEQCFETSDGEQIVVTRRKSVELPDGVDGVLLTTPSGDCRWIAHRKLNDARAIVESNGLAALADLSRKTWIDSLRYVAEKKSVKTKNDYGLRPPQLGALFAVGSHWSLHQTPATIIMPTGTGKTETMLSVVAAHQFKKVLVTVPNKALRKQTAEKFFRFGILRELNVLKPDVANPVVGVVLHRPKSTHELTLFNDCNVTVGIPSSLAGGTATNYLDAVSETVHALVVDEAHHVAARTWRLLRDAFRDRHVLQFTATPYRSDNKLVDGSIIYEYPLSAAQRDQYFTPINFAPVYDLDDDTADVTVVTRAVEILSKDLKAGFDHLLMARCKSIDRAKKVHEFYEQLAPEHHPILIHSDLKDADQRLTRLRERNSRIVVCVNMLGEGVDIPALKIAAIHDSHQSLAVLLQFVGRFARTGGAALGEASVVANIANSRVSLSLEQLYSQDADWNSLLKELSSEAAKEHAEFIRFLEESTPFGTGAGNEDEDVPSVSQQSLRPIFSSLFYNAPTFNPRRFHEGLPDSYNVVRVWINEATQTIYFVTRLTNRVKWTKSKELQDEQWDLFVLHYDQKLKVLCLASTNKGSHFESLAKAVGASTKINGERMFRSLGHIGRLVFNNLGVTKHGRRNLSFAMYTGVDVKQALSEAETAGSRKSNISGYGWEEGIQVTIGCSYKGRVWSKMAGTVPQFIDWAEGVATKLVDESIDTKSIIANVLIPDFANFYPKYEVLSLDWPKELLVMAEDRVAIIDRDAEHELFVLDIAYEDVDATRKHLTFSIVADSVQDVLGTYKLSIDGQAGFSVTSIVGQQLQLRIGNLDHSLETYFNDYPPLVRFVDLSEVDGNILLKAENSGVITIPADRLTAWNWDDVDITKESIWKNGVKRKDSIQFRVAEHFISEGFGVVFDDDGAGEAADLVCLKEENTHIRLLLVHCKYSGAPKEGKRIKDVVEVASQAVRSARRPGSINKLAAHIMHRFKNRKIEAGRKLYLCGSPADLSRMERASRFKEVRPEIMIVQPGVSVQNLTKDQSIVLGGAVAYVKQTLGLDLDVICSE